MCEQLDYWYYNKFRPALRAFLRRVRRPLVPVHSSSWDNWDHNHICLAAHLLEEDDFRAVCPHKGMIWLPAYDDECDWCKYGALVNFLTKDGEKRIEIRAWDDVVSAHTMNLWEE